MALYILGIMFVIMFIVMVVGKALALNPLSKGYVVFGIFVAFLHSLFITLSMVVTVLCLGAYALHSFSMYEIGYLNTLGYYIPLCVSILGISFSVRYVIIPWARDKFSCSMTLRHALRTLQRLRKKTSLDVHIISHTPLFSKEPWWEGFYPGNLGPYPDLKRLNLVFIVQGEGDFTVPECDRTTTVLDEDRTVTHSFKHMYYHMYFSSSEYKDPDSVIIFDNSLTMLGSEIDRVHSEISYRNMTAKRSTILILMDTTEESLADGVKAVNSIRIMDRVKDRVVLAGAPMITMFSRYYFTCLKRK